MVLFIRDDETAAGSVCETRTLRRLSIGGAVHVFSRPVELVQSQLPNDADAATAATIARMRVISSADAGLFVPLARSLGAGGDVGRFVSAVHGWVREHVSFVQDSQLAGVLGLAIPPDEAEILVQPSELLGMSHPAGDCDDFSMLVAAILAAGGVSCSFATVAANSAAPDKYSHVYVVAHTPNGDVPIDASHGRRAGWAVPNRFGKLRYWPMVISGYNPMGAYDPAVDGGVYASGEVPTFSATGTAKADPWWLQLITQGANTANYILRNRLTAPVLVRGADGSVTIRNTSADPETMARTGAANPTGAPADPNASALPEWAVPVMIGGALLVFIVAMKGKKQS